MPPSIEARIHAVYAELPARERELADVLLEMQPELAAYSATELAARAGVSKATAARLFRRLGYTDFNELRQRARDERQPGSPLDELASANRPQGTLAAYVAHDVQNLSRMAEALSPEALAGAVDILAGARRVFVVGLRNNFALALYARGLLNQVMPDVRVLPQGGYTVAEELATVGEDDAVLALAFRRRLPLLAEMLQAASEQGAGVVLIGDPTVDTCARHAEVTLRCPCHGVSLFDSYTAAMTLLNYLCSSVAVALGGAAKDQLADIEALHENFGGFTP